ASVHLPLAGLHNAYNATAAIAAGFAIDASKDAVVRGIEQARGAFGRDERIKVGQGSITLTLVKNPVGFNQSLAAAGEADRLLIAINDLFADGTDVSWLWDVDFERLADVPITCSGLRARDMAVRLKYAGLDAADIEESLAAAVERSIGQAREGEHVVAF